MIGIIANYLGVQYQGDSVVEMDDPSTENRSTGEATATLLTDDELVPRLVEQFDKGAVSDDQLITLRDHLVPEETPSMAVKLDHVRAKVADLEAYSDALEEFIDGEGTARFLLEELRDDIRATNTGLEELTTQLRSVEDDQSSVHDELARLEELLTKLDDYVHTLEGRHSRELVGVDAKVERVEQTVEGVQNDVERLNRRVTAVESLEAEVEKLQELESTVSALEADLRDFGPVADEVEGLADQVDSLEAVRDDIRAVHHLRDRVTDVDSMAMEFAEVRDRVTELESFRSKFLAAVGGSGHPR